MSYIPPITADLIYEPSKLEKEIIDEQDHYIYKQIMSVSNIVVDEERFKKALAFDRGQFYEGYHQGYEARDNEIVRCKDCKYCTEQGDWCQNEKVQSMCFTDGEVEYYFGDKRGHLYPDMDFFCKYGERKETK